MTEADLCLKIIDHFEGFDIYKEVPTSGIVDLMVVKGGIRTAIEAKLSLNFEVIWQAYNNRPFAHYSYAAFLTTKKYGLVHPAQEVLCKHIGIGVIALIDQRYWVIDEAGQKVWKEKYEIKELIKPKLIRKIRSVDLHDYMKRSVAGSQNNRITAFGYFVECLEKVVATKKSGITIKDTFDMLEFRHYRTLGLFRSSVVKYCNTGVIKTVKYSDGKLYLKKEEAQQV